MCALAATAFTLESLQQNWRELEVRDLADGIPSWGLRRFQPQADEIIERTVTELADDLWQPQPLTELTIATNRKQRTLHIPSVIDRIVARAVLNAVTPHVDPELGTAAYAYRPGRGVSDAVQQVVRFRDEGLYWVVRTDVKDCFPSIPQGLAFRLLHALLPDTSLDPVLTALECRHYRSRSGGLRPLTGVPQGCPLSPILANLVLRHLDDALLTQGFPTVRYGDDLLIAATSQAEAWEALRVANHAIEELDMELNNTKTTVQTFDDGFTYLGEDFGPKYPPLLAEHRVDEPDDKVLYAGVQGGRVRVKEGRVLVESKDKTTLLDVPTGQVRRIVCFGSVGLSAGARSWALSQDVEVVFASRKGSYLGTLHSHSDAWRPARLMAQLTIQDSPRALRIGQAIVSAKISNQQTVLRSFNRRSTVEAVTDAIGQLRELQKMVPEATTPMEIMGLEGAAARFYFPALGTLVPAELQFSTRSRQPPQDPVNSALSLLYTILLGECVTALHAAGLDPGIGVLHSVQENRPSLALDLMEEFRPLVVDQVVMEATRLKRFRPEHARREPKRGVLLTKAGKDALLLGYERRMNTKVSGALPDYAGIYRRHIYRQAQRLRAAIMSEEHLWTGLSWR